MNGFSCSVTPWKSKGRRRNRVATEQSLDRLRLRPLVRADDARPPQRRRVERTEPLGLGVESGL
jgi:hypothetical protein